MIPETILEAMQIMKYGLLWSYHPIASHNLLINFTKVSNFSAILCISRNFWTGSKNNLIRILTSTLYLRIWSDFYSSFQSLLKFWFGEAQRPKQTSREQLFIKDFWSQEKPDGGHSQWGKPKSNGVEFTTLKNEPMDLVVVKKVESA